MRKEGNFGMVLLKLKPKPAKPNAEREDLLDRSTLVDAPSAALGAMFSAVVPANGDGLDVSAPPTLPSTAAAAVTPAWGSATLNPLT